MAVRLEGKGRARFCLQHVQDRDGEPDDFWADVSMMSDRRIDPLQSLDMQGAVRGVMVDYVDGNIEFIYRRFERAAWMRVVASDYQSDEERARCSQYLITIGPVS